MFCNKVTDVLHSSWQLVYTHTNTEWVFFLPRCPACKWLLLFWSVGVRGESIWGLDLWPVPLQSHAIWQWLLVNLDPSSRVAPSSLKVAQAALLGDDTRALRVFSGSRCLHDGAGRPQQREWPQPALGLPFPGSLKAFAKHMWHPRVSAKHSTELTKVPPWESWPVIWRSLTIALSRCQGSRAKQMDGPSGIG